MVKQATRAIFLAKYVLDTKPQELLSKETVDEANN